MTADDRRRLHERYEKIAKSGDTTTTACDFHLRDLEIKLAMEYMRKGDKVLDVGCGPGVALRRYVTELEVEGVGVDYAGNMIEFARERTEMESPDANIDYHVCSVEEMPFDGQSFDVVTSHRCLMALLDWTRQKVALKEIHRVLKSGGVLVLMEGTSDGVEKLNYYRRVFGLSEIDPSGRDRLFTRKFQEKELLEFIGKYYELLSLRHFGMYYFLTRIVQPLLVHPESPRYDHKLNEVAKKISETLPDFEGIGHLRGFVLRRKG